MPLLAFLFAACSTPPPRAYGIGDPIPLGPYTVSVTHSDTRNDGALGVLSVHFRLRCSTSPRDLNRFLDRYVDAFSARDSEGNKYRGFPAPDTPPRRNRPGGAAAIRQRAESPEERMANASAELERWTVVFVVPANARGFTLYVENRTPRSGQPGAATIALGH
jgi:hypothetical protein